MTRRLEAAKIGPPCSMVGLYPIEGGCVVAQHGCNWRTNITEGTERMKTQIGKILGIAAIAGVMVVAGCGKKSDSAGMAEKAGAALDKAAEKTVQAANTAAEKTAEAAKVTAQATKDAAGVAVEKTGAAMEKAGSAVEKTGENMQK
jgi:hypothetical protein